jgi:hypothetical protein
MTPIRGDLVVVRCLFMMMFCLLFSSCTKQQSYRHKKSVEQSLDKRQDTILDTIIRQEAMLVDIPIPLFDERIIQSSSYSTESDTLIFGYKSPLSPAQAIDFFLTQMERLGWKHLVTFEGMESLLQFESPDRYCTVVVKNSGISPSHSCIFIHIKRASTDACP